METFQWTRGSTENLVDLFQMYPLLYDTIADNRPKGVHCARRGLDKNIVSTTASERAVFSVMSLGVALRTDESGASEAAETFIFLASI